MIADDPMNVSVIGTGSSGASVAGVLKRQGCQVLAIDASKTAADSTHNSVSPRADLDDGIRQRLSRCVSPDTAVAVVDMPNDELACTQCLLHLKKLGVGRLFATARRSMNPFLLNLVGATDVVFPESDTAERVAQRIVNSGPLARVDAADWHP